MWELDCKEGWVPRNQCFWPVVLEKTLESPLDCKEIQPVHPKGDQSWVFIGRTDTEALILWSPDVKNWLIGKDPDVGKDWRQEKEGTAEDGMAGWHHQLDGHYFEQASGVGNGQGSLACYSPWGLRVRHNWATELTDLISFIRWLFLLIWTLLLSHFMTCGILALWPGIEPTTLALEAQSLKHWTAREVLRSLSIFSSFLNNIFKRPKDLTFKTVARSKGKEEFSWTYRLGRCFFHPPPPQFFPLSIKSSHLISRICLLNSKRLSIV